MLKIFKLFTNIKAILFITNIILIIYKIKIFNKILDKKLEMSNGPFLQIKIVKYLYLL